MSGEAYASLSSRVISLEDIIRQQEQTIGIVLQRLRDVEQYAAAESRSREQAQQQLYQLLDERGGSSAEAAQQMQAILQNQNERLAGLQAEVQGHAAALRGVNDKYDVALRGMEQRVQADVGGVHQRAQTGEAASLEAIRGLQAQLQGLSNATQAVDARSRDDLLAVQQQLGGELAAMRQRSDNLESAIRDALRDVHTALSGELRTAEAQQRSALDAATQRLSGAVDALDQRTRADMNQLHSVEQGDVTELGRRIEDVERNLREMLQASSNGLASEVAQVAQHSQSLDRRQAAAHNTVLQELAKHDGQLESVDLNWRASVTDLSALLRESVAAAQQQAAAGDQALQRQMAALESRFNTAAETLARGIADVTRTMQESCVRPLGEAQRALSAQEQRLSRVADDYATMQESIKTFASRVDQDAIQFKQVVEAAVRAAHADLLDRINFTTAAITMQQDPETVRLEVHRALKKLWEEAKGAFLTQHSLQGVEAQVAALESAVRVELCALAERHNEVQRSVDYIRLAQQQQQQQQRYPASAGREAYQHEERFSSYTSHEGPPAPAYSAPVQAEKRSLPQEPVAEHQTASVQTEPKEATKSAVAAREAPADDPLPPPLPPLQAFASESPHPLKPQRPSVEEIDTNSSEDGSDSVSREHDARLQQHEEDITDLWASLNRLRSQQAEVGSRASPTALLQMEDRAAERSRANSAASRADGARRDASAAAAGAIEAHRSAADAAEDAGAASFAARTAAEEADAASRVARTAATAAAGSERAAEAAQGETLRMAGEVRVALGRLNQLEARLQRQLAELEERGQRGSRPKHVAKAATRHSSAATVFAERPPSLDEEAIRNSSPRGPHSVSESAAAPEAEPAPYLYHEEEEKPVQQARVNVAAASLMAYSPTKAAEREAAKPGERLLEVPGISTGEVFIVRQDKTDRTTPASMRPKASFRESPLPPLAPTPLKAVTPLASGAAVPIPSTPAESEASVAVPRRGSALSEVLLPTHQFVRKREYGNFKDFTKQEIDALWVELLNVRRSQGMSKEEVLVQVSQAKEQVLSTVIHLVQRQESEMLGMLSNIKMQLLELRREPGAAAAVRDVKVFPIDNGQHLEEFMRAISGNTPPRSVDRSTVAESPDEKHRHHHPYHSQQQKQPSHQSPHATRKPTPTPTATTVDAAKVFKSTPLHPARKAVQSAPPPRWNDNSIGRTTPTSAPLLHSPNTDAADSAPSSGRSASPLIPQLIAPVVHRRSSLPSKAELTEVFFTDGDHDFPQRRSGNVQPKRPSGRSAAKNSEPVESGPPHGHLYAVAAPVIPSSVTAAARPAEPVSATAAQHRPAAVSTSYVSPAADSSLHIASPYVAAGEGALQPYQLPLPLDVSRGGAAAPASAPAAAPLRLEDRRRYLKEEGRSPRDPAGGAFHLNPLQGMTNPRNSPPPSSRREPGGRRDPPSPREDPQELSRRVLQEEPRRQHDARPPRYQLIQTTPPRQSTDNRSAAGALVPLTDTSPEKYQPATIRDNSDIYYESVMEQRPVRLSIRRSSNSASNTPTYPTKSPGVARHTLLPDEAIRVRVPPPNAYAAPTSSPQPVAAPVPQSRITVLQPTPMEHPPPLPPQPQQRAVAPDAVRVARTPSQQPPAVKVAQPQEPLRVRSHSPPLRPSGEDKKKAARSPQEAVRVGSSPPAVRVSAEERKAAGLPLRGGGVVVGPTASSRAHAGHNPHVYAPNSGRGREAHNSPPSLNSSAQRERGERSRPSPSDRGGAAPMVPVRVLDVPRDAAADPQGSLNTSVKIRVHPYQNTPQDKH